MVRCNWLWTFGAALVLVTAVLIQGCGLKADPAPRRIQSLMPVTEIRLQQAAGGIFEYDAMRIYASGRSDSFLGKMQGIDLR
jgi:hypothetical protein